MYDSAVLIGRFQPVHSGHLALLQHALGQARQVLVIAGSAHQARTPRNPFTWQERAAMLQQSVSAAEAARIQVLPLRDYYDAPRWAAALRAAVASVTGDTGGAGPGARIALVGHFKDASSDYLGGFPDWELISLPRQDAMDATPIRDAWLGLAQATPAAALDAALDAALAPLAAGIPAATRAQLHALLQHPAYARLQQEWRMLRDYRASWAGAPYPPVFVTVDALVRAQDQVLLIRRAQAPGQGLLALPGGFIDAQETLWQSCLRELAEETHWPLDAAQMRAALRGVALFDHPGRSQRGRVISQVHYFELGGAPVPVQGGDDASSAQWLPISQLAALQEQFHDDHFHILDHFLGLQA